MTSSTNLERAAYAPITLGRRAWTFLAAAVVCITLTLLTLPRFQDDSIYYTDEIRAFDQTGSGLSGSMSDFGHLIWRWCGYGLFHLARPLWLALDEGSLRYAYFWPLLILTWSAGCWALYLCFRLAGHFTANRMVIAGAGLAYIAGNAMLNNLHSGTSYVPGLALVLASTLCLLDAARADDTGWRRPLLGGIAFAAAVAVWFPYILLAPAVLLVPSLLAAGGRANRQITARAALASAVSLMAVYAIPVIYFRLFSVTQLKTWMTGASHGWDQNRRLLRWVFGFPRSFLYMAKDGILFKRYLFHDPFAPVSALDLARASLAKVGFFFAYIAAVTWALVRRKGKGPLLWFLCGMAPCTLFAIYVFEPGSVERYIPLIPFLLAGSVIACEQRWARYVCGAFALLTVCNNVPPYWAPSVRHEYHLTELRVQDLKGRFKPGSLALVTHTQDDLSTIRGAYVFHPVNREDWLRLYIVAAAGTTFARSWRELAAAKCFETWAQGGDVWISDRFFAERPQPQWDWTEGDDPNLRWADVSLFFRQFDKGIDVGAPDGFTLLEKTAKNSRILESLPANAPLQVPLAGLSPVALPRR